MAPILLVGLQSDLRTDEAYQEKMKNEKQTYCTMETIENVKKYIGASKYVECSALKNENVKNVFSEAIKCAISEKGKKIKKNNKNCIVS
jgi:GTPase SAR1 family protein